MMQARTIRAKFLAGNPLVRPSDHFCKRLKNRANIRKEKQRYNFIKKVSEHAIKLTDIPKEKFNDFFYYMKSKLRYIQKKNMYNYLVLFENYFILTSYSGDLVTLYDIDEEYKGVYFEIKQELAKQAAVENAESIQESIDEDITSIEENNETLSKGEIE